MVLNKEKVIIFDTTLRDGEQSPGAVLKPDEKLKIAQALEDLNVDVIEAGFPVSSPGDFLAVRTIAKKIRKPVICALARAVEKDIKIAWEAVKLAAHPRIHTFIGVSGIHLQHQMGKTETEVLEIVKKSIKQAKTFVEDVQFGMMDASRAKFNFLVKVMETALESGAKTLDLADTIGYLLPWEMEKWIKKLRKNVKGINKATLSIHCHNDLGLATINALSALKEGAGQVDCTINGIGERAGNSSLEEIVMTLKLKQKYFHLTTDINSAKIYFASRLVSRLTHMPIQFNKAIVGRNAFSHASGIHQDGFLKNRRTFEIMRPETIGLKKSKIVLGAGSGRHALKYRLSLLGFNLSDEEMVKIYEAFLKVAEKKRIVTNKDLVNIMKKQ